MEHSPEIQLQPRKVANSPRRSSNRSGKATKRSSSAGAFRSKKNSSGSQSARLAWIESVNKYNTGFTDRGFKSGTSTQDKWTETLRQLGVSTDETYSGLNKSDSMSFLSTSHYLRQVVGLEKASKQDSARIGSSGIGNYKSPEDYHDEITELKKKILTLTQEIAHYKQNAQRLKEENKKKEKEIDHLTNPAKSDDLRRTLTDRRGENATVIQNMKQRILKLEQKLKEKETECSKLLSDLKLTKNEEMKIHLEEMFTEIVRLNRAFEMKEKYSEENKQSKTPRKLMKNENTEVIKALREDVLKMNAKNHELQIENNDLKNELKILKAESVQEKEYKKKYDDMNKADLLDVVIKLESRLERAERWAAACTEGDCEKSAIEGKAILHGSLQDRLHQLNKKETELLQEIEKKNKVNKQLQEDRIYYRNKCDEKDKEIKDLKKQLEKTNANSSLPFAKSESYSSLSRSSPTIRRSSSILSKATQEKAEKLRRNNAAKKIQRGWKDYVDRKEQSEATAYVQSALRSHKIRSDLMGAEKNVYNATDSDAESFIFDAVLAHKERRDILKSKSNDSILIARSKSPSDRNRMQYADGKANILSYKQVPATKVTRLENRKYVDNNEYDN